MKIPNEINSRYSKSPRKLAQLLEEKSENNVKQQFIQNELFQAQHYLKDYVNNLKKQTIINLDTEINKILFNKPNRKEENFSETKNIRLNKKHFTLSKNKDINFNIKKRRMSENAFKFINAQKNKREEFKSNKEYYIRTVKSSPRKTSKQSHNPHNKIPNIMTSKSLNTFSSDTLTKRQLLEKSLEKKSPKKTIDIKKSFFFLGKPKVFNGENDSKSIVYNNETNNDFIKLTNMSNKDIIELNELKNELKNSIIGNSVVLGLDFPKIFLDDENKEKNNILIAKEIKEKHRILTRKGYVYDSFDDEENIDEIISFNYINPNAFIIKFIDLFVFILTFYNPLFLGKSDIYCEVNYQSYFIFLFNILIDIVFIIDIIINFCVAYYDFDELLIIEFHLIAKHYLKTWFIIDFISAIPFLTIFNIFNKKCKNESFLNHPFYGKNFFYLLILLRLLKIFKVIWRNTFLKFLWHKLSKIRHFNIYGRLIINIITFFISLHIVVCAFIFIGKNDYPNWISHFNHSNKNFKELYLIAVYYIITTLTTVGYGDLTCISLSEKIFGLFMEVVGICSYSWALTEISNYIKVLNEKKEELSNKIQILDDIKLNCYRLFPDELYDRTKRYLKYKHFNEKKNIHLIFEELPIGLRNTLIYEIYKPEIHNFKFFNDFPNSDFVVKVILAFKPILALKNDILIKNGELVEDIIFVKKGSLSLEIPFTFEKSNKKKNDKNAKFMRRAALFFNNDARENGIENNNVYNLNQSNEIKRNSLKFSFSYINALKYNREEEKENIHYYRILKIRKNEHFGDLLMLLDQRSPLCLRVKSKRAELFFLNKEDAINISTNYPQYWKKINQKSLFNMEQIKRLTNKIIKIISAQNGISIKRNKKVKNSSISNSISFIDDDDYYLKTIPSLSHTSEFQNDYFINENEFNKGEEEEFESEEENENYSKRKSVYENYQNKLCLQTIMENNNIESDSSYINSSSSITESGFEINKNNTIRVNQSNTGLHSKSNKSKRNKINLTPYQDDEINNEIYPKENFITAPQLNKQNYKNKKENLDNLSICSTEISFSINSEYENIDELSDYIYSKDIIFRTKVKDFIQEEVQNKLDNRRTKIFKTNKSEEVSNVFNKIKSRENSKKNLLKKNKEINNFKNSNFKQIKKNYYKRNKDSNRELINGSNDEEEKEKNKNMNKTESKKNLINVITEKIEKKNMNLNNPDLFYSKEFKKYMKNSKSALRDISPVPEEKDKRKN